MDLNVLTVCGLRALECLVAVDSMAYFEAKVIVYCQIVLCLDLFF